MSNLNEEFVLYMLTKFSVSLDTKKKELLALKAKQLQRYKEIMALIHKRNAMYICLMHAKKGSRLWTQVKARHGQFWEFDIPRKSEQFFKESFRMSRVCFTILCDELDTMARSDTTYRDCIPLDKRIAIALYSLRSSAEYSTIGRLFGVSKSSVCKILSEFCIAVWNILGPKFMSGSSLTQENIVECVEGFEKIGFPQCLGAVDGCHFEVRPSAHDAVEYLNNKGWYSMVLLALVDYRYRFMYVDIGAPGRYNDSEIFKKSKLKSVLQSCPLLKSNAKRICGVNVPVVVLGDSAFHFSKYLMKPYPYRTEHTATEPSEKKFNDELSKARRVVENAFDHIKARFRRIGNGIDNDIKKAAAIIKCCCVLHNFLIEHNDVINHEWLRSLNAYECTAQREQPDQADVFSDRNNNAEDIRKAIATFLVSAEPSSRVEDSSADVDEPMLL